ncbi:MAG: DNA polymerase III subunit delta [Lachnospiraceae bacterium]|nr:DNA polymerase III subunit delta [Lachnospiraceae bacterium]
MKDLANDIKTCQFKNVYLFYGEESYLKRFYKNKLRESVIPPGDSMNFASFDGNSFDVREVIGLCDTMPFFADHRLVVVENSDAFRNGNEELISYIENIPESTILLFVEDNVDKRGRMYKTVAKCGRAVDMARLKPADLEKWVMAGLKRNNRQISRPAFELFLSKVGDSLENVDKELEKLVDYTYGRESVTEADVEAVCTVRTESRVFDMIDAIVAGNFKQALDLYYDMLTLKEPPMRILFLIARQYSLLLKTRLLLDEHLPKAEIASRMGISDWLAGKYIRMAGGFSAEYLESCVHRCVTAEEDVKTGRLNDRLSVELVISGFSHKK